MPATPLFIFVVSIGTVVSKQIKVRYKSFPIGALVQWLWEETHVPKVVSSYPGTVYCMDMTFVHIYSDVCLKRRKQIKKEGGVGPI